MNLKTAFVILVVGALASVSAGQGYRAFMNVDIASHPERLLQRDDVRTDLQLTDDQKSKLFDMSQGLADRFREVFRSVGNDPDARQKAIANITKKIVEEVNQILTPGQQTRLKEVAIQVAGFSCVTIPEIQKSLALTSDQKSKIDDLAARQKKATGEATAKLQTGEIQMADLPEIVKKNTKVLNDEIGKVLTQAQKDKLKTLGGKTFVPKDDQDSGG